MLVHKVTDIDGEALQHAASADGTDCTLCGLTLDGDQKIVLSQEEVQGKITCDICLRIIRYCKKLKL